MAMNFAEYLLPAVASEDQLLFVICLIVVATLDICTKHCVARTTKNKKKRRCGMDIDPIVTLTAISELKNLSSNTRRQRAHLEMIAADTTCTHEEWKRPHRTQASEIAEKWLAEAKALEEIILKIVSKQSKREYAADECKYTEDAYDKDYWAIA
ncbi:hypothetical protein KC356_g5021 [Hortaea werneckii]|nr:hypothetical protein KC356_g5021 [Hortaea werneckii]